MAKLTMVFGVLLVLLSAGAFAFISHFPHTLIPGAFGIVLIVLGALARTPDQKRRMLFMHIAVTVALLGFLGTIPGFIGIVRMWTGHLVARPEAAQVQAMMGSLCLIFVLLCVRSFISARRARAS